jgi:hypothetical protein
MAQGQIVFICAVPMVALYAFTGITKQRYNTNTLGHALGNAWTVDKRKRLYGAMISVRLQNYQGYW